MRTITPTDYALLTPMERLAFDTWIEQEGIGPRNDISELRVWDDGTVAVTRLLRDAEGHRYSIDGKRAASETIVHECAQALPV